MEEKIKELEEKIKTLKSFRRDIMKVDGELIIKVNEKFVDLETADYATLMSTLAYLISLKESYLKALTQVGIVEEDEREEEIKGYLYFGYPVDWWIGETESRVREKLINRKIRELKKKG